MNNKYYLFTGETDLSSCRLVNVRENDGSLIFQEGGLFISPCLDSGENDTLWDNVEIVFPQKRGGYFCFTAFSSDRLEADVAGGKTPISQILNEIASGHRLSELSADIRAVCFVDPDIAPLHQLRGRYLWFIVEAFPAGGEAIVIDQIRIRYPFISYMQALPEVVRRTDNGELASLLAMYKQVVDRLDRQIVDFDDDLDPELAKGEALDRLVSWQGIPVSGIWGEDILRRLIKESAGLIRRKGTKAALSRLFEILLGEPPVIEENSGGDPFRFTIRVKYSLVRDRARHRELLHLLNEFSPAGTTPRLLLDKGGNGFTIGSDTTLADDSFDSGMIL